MATPNVTTTLSPTPDVLRSPPLQALQPPSPSRPDTGSLLVARTQLLQSPRKTPGTKEYLPNELLLALRKQQQPSLAESSLQDANHLPPVKGPQVTHPHASVWGHPKQRSRFKHLLNNPPCICGSGRDISFLYDVPGSENNTVVSSAIDKPTQWTVPTSLVPNEYHIVKHPKVLGMEYYNETFAARTSDHDHHMTIFPSMKPSGRHEVLALKQTMDEMLERAGIKKQLDDSDLQGPTQMHNLLDLVQKEQDIYNICFHELIRQVSVQCAERGELMAELRKRYSNLLDRIPHQVKGLHDEVLAQRALDKKLTSELSRFKQSVTTLTSDLSELRDHEMTITDDVTAAQENLISALAETEKNANLLAEYHDLYELQRRRLEDQHVQLSQEKETWQQACYSLALRVAEQRSLQTIQRLQLSEKSWSKLASHFNILLSDKDTQQLCELQGCIQVWKEKTIEFVQKLQAMEQTMVQKLSQVEESVKQWIAVLKSEEDGVKGLEMDEIEELWKNLSEWQQILNLQSEQFSGEVLLQRQEDLKSIRTVISQWTEVSLALVWRHYDANGIKQQPPPEEEEEETVEDENQPDESVNQHFVMSMIAHTDVFMEQLATRTSGENGVAVGYVHLITPMEAWDTKLNIAINRTDKKLSTTEWSRLLSLLHKWVEQIQAISRLLTASDGLRVGGTGGQTSPKVLPLYELVTLADKWRSSFTHSIDSQDTKLADEVLKLHSSLVQWMIELLLCFVADKGETATTDRDEEKKAVTTTIGEKSLLSSISDLHAVQPVLAELITAFSHQLSSSCREIVQEIVDENKKKGSTDAEEEKNELSRMTEETSEWVKSSHLLVEELLKLRHREMEEFVEKEREAQEQIPVPPSSDTEEQVDSGTPRELPENMNVLGVDGNVHQKSLQLVIEETEMPPAQTTAQLGLFTEEVLPEGRGALKKDVEALVIELDKIKQELKEQETLTAAAEERASATDKELKEANERITKLESELQKRAEEARQLSGGRQRNTKTTKHTKPNRAESKRKL